MASTERQTVYRGKDRRTGREVTIKELPSEKLTKDAQVALFQSEIRALNRVRHPNLIEMLDHFSERGNLYIVFEYRPGMSLGEMLAAEGPLPAELVFPIFLDICTGLIESHKVGLIHQEITPSSIFLLGDTTCMQLAKLTELGRSRIKDETLQIETDPVLAIRPEYSSPETLTGTTTDERSDIYSLGMVLYATLTGKLPFACDDVQQLIEKQMNGLPRRFKETAPQFDIPFHIEATVFKCLAKNKEDRYQSASELAEALKTWRHDFRQERTPITVAKPAKHSEYSIEELNKIGTRYRPATVEITATEVPVEEEILSDTTPTFMPRPNRLVPVYAVAAVVAVLVGFLVTVNIRQSLQQQELEQQVYAPQIKQQFAALPPTIGAGAAFAAAIPTTQTNSIEPVEVSAPKAVERIVPVHRHQPEHVLERYTARTISPTQISERPHRRAYQTSYMVVQ
jgi:serine/threonine protein kinase